MQNLASVTFLMVCCCLLQFWLQLKCFHNCFDKCDRKFILLGIQVNIDVILLSTSCTVSILMTIGSRHFIILQRTLSENFCDSFINTVGRTPLAMCEVELMERV